VSGGVGVPRGAGGVLSAAAAPAKENRLGVRFMALEPWARGTECAEPRRFRSALPPTAPAIGNAVANALGGVRIRDLPIKPDKIIAALRDAKEKLT
jgi:hypothetical protein